MASMAQQDDPSPHSPSTASSARSASLAVAPHADEQAASKLSTSPHDPLRRPPASILANAHEALSVADVKKASKRSAIKAAFVPAQPGRKIKTDGRPLGKTFERTVPLPADTKISGGQVLDYDPRGDVGAGDGVVLAPRRTPSSASSSPPSSSPQQKGAEGDGYIAASPDQEYDGTGTFAGASSSSSSVDSYDGSRGRSRTDTMSTHDSTLTSETSSSSSHAASIRFAPLPISGRLKRANSITIGVAARSHLLRSQGPGRNSMYPPQPTQPPLPHGMSWQHHQQPQRSGASGQQPQTGRNQSPSTHASSGSSHTGAAPPQMTWYNGGSRPDDVIDLGEEISKRCKSAWKKLRGSSVSESDTPSATKTPTSNEAAIPPPRPNETTKGPVSNVVRTSVEDTTGDRTPRRRPTSPSSEAAGGSTADGISKLSLEDGADAVEPQGSHRDHFPPHHLPGDHRNGDHDEAEGSKTPRQGVHRRLSTGAFLKNASLREMQEERRRGLLGVDASESDHAQGQGDDLTMADGEPLSSSDGPLRSQHGAADVHGEEEEAAAARLKEGLGSTGAGTVLGRLAGWASTGNGDAAKGNHQDTPTHSGQDGASRSGQGTKKGRIVVDPRNPEQEEFHADGDDDDDDDDDRASENASDDGDGDGDEDEDEEMRQAEELAQRSLSAGAKAGGVEIVH
ncbi:unnamed protein product [Parajaminaea phylloscopi]